jgi:hypothetical protein
MSNPERNRGEKGLAGRGAVRTPRGFDRRAARESRWCAQSLVDAATLAQQLGVSRTIIYEHARELGAVRIVTGERGRLRFDSVQVRQVLAEKDVQGVPPKR